MPISHSAQASWYALVGNTVFDGKNVMIRNNTDLGKNAKKT
jgi:hypothetical protein